MTDEKGNQYIDTLQALKLSKENMKKMLSSKLKALIVEGDKKIFYRYQQQGHERKDCTVPSERIHCKKCGSQKQNMYPSYMRMMKPESDESISLRRSPPPRRNPPSSSKAGSTTQEKFHNKKRNV